MQTVANDWDRRGSSSRSQATKRTIAAALLIWLTCAAPIAPAHAQEADPDPDRRYRVVDVSDDDLLNVREAPSATASQTAELQPNATAVIVTGAAFSIDGSTWWEVLDPDAPSNTGWVNARFLAPMEPAGSAEQHFPLRCTGTEPFWGIEIAASEARFSTPEQPSRRWESGEWVDASNRTGRFAISLKDEGAVGHAAVLRGSCSDGMSDIRYPFEVLLIAPSGSVFSGCCKRGAE